jgi:uncharacterized protein with HEPN domain
MSNFALAVLAEMLGNASKAVEYAERGGDRWEQDGLIADAVANRVRQVTELAKYAFPEDEKKDYPQVPWDELARARDFYTHHYRDLDLERLRGTVDGPLHELLDILIELDLPDIEEYSARD